MYYTQQVRLPEGYPSDDPPYFELDAVPLSGADRQSITDTLTNLYADNIGEPIIYIWVEACRDYVSSVEVRADDNEVNDESLNELVVSPEVIESQVKGWFKIQYKLCCYN